MCLSEPVYTRTCTCAHLLPVSAVVCVRLSWAPWAVALHMLLGGGGVGDGLGRPTLVLWGPGFSELTPALLWPSAWVTGQPWLSTGSGALPGSLSDLLGPCTLPVPTRSKILLPRAVSHPGEWGGVSGWAAVLKGEGRRNGSSRDFSDIRVLEMGQMIIIVEMEVRVEGGGNRGENWGRWRYL